MNLTPLLQSAGPHLHSLVTPKAGAYDALRGLESQGAAVRFVRGAKATTKAALFDELAAALQFPFYFGENWDACNDCLGELTWISQNTGAGVIVFLDAARLLESTPVDDRKTLADLLGQLASGHIAAKSRPNRPAIHVVFQCEAKDAAALAKQWHGLASLQ